MPHIPEVHLLRSEQLVAPSRKWTPRILTPAEIPFPASALELESVFTTDFMGLLFEAVILQIRHDLEVIQPISNRQRPILLDDLTSTLRQGETTLNLADIEQHLVNSARVKTLALYSGENGIRLTTDPQQVARATVAEDHPVPLHQRMSLGWAPQSRPQIWQEVRPIRWNALQRVAFRNLAVTFTNLALIQLAKTGQVVLDEYPSST